MITTKLISSKFCPTAIEFPAAWLWLTDEMIPRYVKQTYSPRDAWKDKLFSKEDARFFSKGIEELSELFNHERPKSKVPYFQHPKFRSSYLLYFFPLQAGKFLTLFELHLPAIRAALKHAEKTGVLRIADIGAGPGTASLALLLFLLHPKLVTGPGVAPQLPAKIELTWFDINATTMDDGKYLVEQLSTHFPKLRGKVEVITHVGPWWKIAPQLKQEFSLIFMGHVLNESAQLPHQQEMLWTSLLKQTGGGGLLILEPAARRAAQTLSAVRDHLFASELVNSDPNRLWGPCLHTGVCPLGHGRDWCHFSTPTRIPGKWFKHFSESLSSEKHWVKFSYVWFTSAEYPAPTRVSNWKRVISDPLAQGPQTTVLLCEPETPGRLAVAKISALGRGDLVEPGKDAVITRKPANRSSNDMYAELPDDDEIEDSDFENE